LTYRNFTFLRNQSFAQSSKIKQEIIPVISKSLTLLSYITYCSDEETLKILFEFLLEDIDEAASYEYISDTVFNTFKSYCISHPVNLIKFKGFEALGYFWIKFPHKLPCSKDIIESIFKAVSTEEEKLLVLSTFNKFFAAIYKNFQEKKNSKKFDFGTVHLFFESFIGNILTFIINESNMLIRHQSITLIKIIMELGNINAHTLLPYIFASLFDYNTEIRFAAVFILEKIIKISKEKFLGSIKECLKLAFKLNKNIYIEQRLINSQVKEKSDDIEEINFTIKPENIFELFKYKIGKSIKDDSLDKKILTKFIQTFQDIKNLDSAFIKSNIEGLKKFEFFEFVGTLIADYKFIHNHEVYTVFNMLYKDFTTGFLVYETKLKELKHDYTEDGVNRLLLLFLTSTLKLAIFKFLSAKYEEVENLENNLKRNIQIDNDSNNHESKVIITKECRNFRFYEFYNCFSLYYKVIFKLASNCHKNKLNLLTQFKKLKNLNKLKTSEIRSHISKYKKKSSKLNEDKLQQFLYSCLFNDEKEINNADARVSLKTDKVANKHRKRVCLDDDKENLGDKNINEEKYHRTTVKEKRKKMK
jgi:hypothetical protein